MITVPDAARRLGRNPETIRRWIRSGRLRSERIGTQHLVDERDLDQIAGGNETLPLPPDLDDTDDGAPQPDWVRLIREERGRH